MDKKMAIDKYGFGAEITKMEYKDIWDWFVKYQEPTNIWKYHKSFLFCEAIFMLGAFIMFIHSFKKGGRWPYLYFASIFHGLVVENVSYFLPHINNFWQAQGVFTFIERRLPLYILLLYPVFYYHASWAMSKLKLKCEYAEYLAFGLIVVLIDMPYDIIGIKYIHWVWHDTDPNIAERHYWVPWNSYYFHACFAASFQFFFHKTRNYLDKRNDLGKWESGTIFSEMISVIVASLLGMPGGCLLFLPIYHPLHDYYKVPSEITSITLLMIFAVIVWKFDRKSNRYTKETNKLDVITKALMLHLILHYTVWLATAIFIKPDDMIATGLHEEIGNCNETVPVETIFWTLKRRKYLCVTDYDEKYYDFNCLPNQKLPKENSVWYTICGTPFENRAEYITILSLISFIAFMIFRTIHFDYDNRIINRLSENERKKLEPRPKSKLKKN